MNKEVDNFLDKLNHPLRPTIDLIRSIILNMNCQIIETIKWNSPNYSFLDKDLITIRIQPIKNIQLILHRGAKKKEQPDQRLIDTSFKLLSWKENDRAIVTFGTHDEVTSNSEALKLVLKNWVMANIDKP